MLTFVGLAVVGFYAKSTDAKIAELQNKLVSLEAGQVSIVKPIELNVTATMYRPTKYETDSSPNITADGTTINISKAGSYRFIAVSRNLLSRWGGPFDYGDYVIIKGTKNHDGIWQIKDTMNPRFVDRIDFLCDVDAKPFKYDNVVLTGI
jgi:hypothetical protein